VDVSQLIRHRLDELGLEQKDLAAAAQVTESYISELLAGCSAIGVALHTRQESETRGLAALRISLRARTAAWDPPEPRRGWHRWD
jgi:hypothetical protein